MGGGQTAPWGHHRGTWFPVFLLTVRAMPEAILGPVMLLPVTISLMFALALALALPSAAATRRLRAGAFLQRLSLFAGLV